MGLEPGDIDAAGGMSKAIYDALYENMKGNFPDEQPSAEVTGGWKKMAYSIAVGVIEHIKSNMVIKGITTKGKTGEPDTEIILTQNNDGTGHVE